MERMSATRSRRPAIRGRCSLTRTPGIRVGMVSNSPRVSGGALGFGSKVSIWLGATYKNSTRTDFALADRVARVLAAGAACTARCGGRPVMAAPVSPRVATCKKSRRQMPSQHCLGVPRIRNMEQYQPVPFDFPTKPFAQGNRTLATAPTTAEYRQQSQAIASQGRFVQTRAEARGAPPSQLARLQARPFQDSWVVS